MEPSTALAQSARGTAVLPELGHVVLYVSDVRRSARFYGEVLGWRALPTPAAAPVAAFSGGRTHHELLLIEVGADATPIPPGRRVGMYHFGVKIGDDDDALRAMVRRLEDCTIAGRACRSRLSEQKSAADRAINGRPIRTETANAAAVATVRMIGWKK